MDVKDYRHYIDVLKSVRSPIDSEEVLRARPVHRFRWPFAKAFWGVGILLMIISSPTTALYAPTVGREVARTPVLAVQTNQTAHAGCASVAKLTLTTPSSTHNVPSVVADVGDSRPDEPIALISGRPSSAVSGVSPERSYRYATAPEPKMRAPLIWSLTTDIAQPLDTRLVVEYPVLSRLLIGFDIGATSRLVTASVADVRFHDTSVVELGGTYTSRLGELVPRTRTITNAAVGLSTRVLLNPVGSYWNCGIGLEETYSGALSTSLRVISSYRLTNMICGTASVALDRAFSANARASVRCGVEVVWW